MSDRELIARATAIGLKTAWGFKILRVHGAQMLQKAIEAVELELAPGFVEQLLAIDTLVLDLCVLLNRKKRAQLPPDSLSVVISDGLPPDSLGEAHRKLIAAAIASCR